VKLSRSLVINLSWHSLIVTLSGCTLDAAKSPAGPEGVRLVGCRIWPLTVDRQVSAWSCTLSAAKPKRASRYVLPYGCPPRPLVAGCRVPVWCSLLAHADRGREPLLTPLITSHRMSSSQDRLQEKCAHPEYGTKRVHMGRVTWLQYHVAQVAAPDPTPRTRSARAAPGAPRGQVSPRDPGPDGLQI